jgi:hypothetical protein
MYLGTWKSFSISELGWEEDWIIRRRIPSKSLWDTTCEMQKLYAENRRSAIVDEKLIICGGSAYTPYVGDIFLHSLYVLRKPKTDLV